jgi:hypothetical protein
MTSIVVEICSVLALILWAKYHRDMGPAWTPTDNIRTAYAMEECGFNSGDLLVITHPQYPTIYPSHLALVVKLEHTFGQLCVWDLDMKEQTSILKPLYVFLRRQPCTRLLFWIQLTGISIQRCLLECLRRYTHVKYDCLVAISHANRIMHEISGLPGIPLIGRTHDRHYYCSTAILNVLIDTGVLSPSILAFTDQKVFQPSLLIMAPDHINQYTVGMARYAAPVSITISATSDNRPSY